MYASVDEATNLGMAYALRLGTIHATLVGFDLSMSPVGPYGPVFRFPIGLPAVLACVSWLDPWALFLVSPVLHATATWLFADVLRANRVPAKYAVLYLLYPGFVLYDRTLFSDGFAASLTTIALSLLLRARGAPTLIAGACLGLALLSRSTSQVITLVVGLGLLASAWCSRETGPVWKSRFAWFLVGLLPFLIVAGCYNAATMGSPFKSTYDLGALSVTNLGKLGPLYALSLLLIYPGMLLAPPAYRGAFWREGLVATTAVLLIAGSYYETTYGNNRLETLVSVTRQVLPVVPFYLLAYCSVLAKVAERPWARRLKVIEVACGALFVTACVISGLHQQHLRVLTGLQAEIKQSLPVDCVVYGNKDIYKLHQPAWDETAYRELPRAGTAQIAEDLRRRPTFVVLYLRSRGFVNEDAANASVLNDMWARLVLREGPPSRSGLLHFYRVVGLTPQARRDAGE